MNYEDPWILLFSRSSKYCKDERSSKPIAIKYCKLPLYKKQHVLMGVRWWLKCALHLGWMSHNGEDCDSKLFETFMPQMPIQTVILPWQSRPRTLRYCKSSLEDGISKLKYFCIWGIFQSPFGKKKKWKKKERT